MSFPLILVVKQLVGRSHFWSPVLTIFLASSFAISADESWLPVSLFEPLTTSYGKERGHKQDKYTSHLDILSTNGLPITRYIAYQALVRVVGRTQGLDETLALPTSDIHNIVNRLAIMAHVGDLNHPALDAYMVALFPELKNAKTQLEQSLSAFSYLSIREGKFNLETRATHMLYTTALMRGIVEGPYLENSDFRGREIVRYLENSLIDQLSSLMGTVSHEAFYETGEKDNAVKIENQILESLMTGFRVGLGERLFPLVFSNIDYNGKPMSSFVQKTNSANICPQMF